MGTQGTSGHVREPHPLSSISRIIYVYHGAATIFNIHDDRSSLLGEVVRACCLEASARDIQLFAFWVIFVSSQDILTRC